MTQKHRHIYFLLYPAAGPLLGYVFIVSSVTFYRLYENGFDLTGFFKAKDVLDFLRMSVFAYLFGGLQALVTGLFVWRCAIKTGKSYLTVTFLVSMLCNLLCAGAISLGSNITVMKALVFLIPAGLFACLVLKALERPFSISTDQVTS